MKFKSKKIITAVVIISIILIIAVGYTFSKFFRSVPGNATAEIATWSFKANAGDENQSLSSIVLKPTNGSKIAPGTNGAFQIKVDSIGSDVDVDYSVYISQEKLPANMRFNVQGHANTYSTMAELAEAELKGTLTRENNNQQRVYTIEWNWPYDVTNGNESLDYNDMLALEIPNLGFEIEVLGKQAQ